MADAGDRRCPTPCDDDCESLCHEDHQVTWKKDHSRWQCPAICNAPRHNGTPEQAHLCGRFAGHDGAHIHTGTNFTEAWGFGHVAS